MLIMTGWTEIELQTYRESVCNDNFDECKNCTKTKEEINKCFFVCMDTVEHVCGN